MRDVIYITGHKNPDTDSICASIAYAELKNKIGNVPAIPIRLGEINRETKFVLDYFEVETPHLLETVKTQVSDLRIDTTSPVSPDISIKMAWSIMKKYNNKTLPIVDDEDRLIGLASTSQITSSYMDIWDTNILSKSNTNLDNILDTLSAKCIYVSSNKKFTGKIVVAAMHPSSCTDFIEEGDIVICGDRSDSQEKIIELKASLMIITGGHTVSDEILEKAKENNCSIITTPYDTFSASRLITQSIPVSYMMTRNNLISFRTDDFIDEIKDIMLQTRYRSYPVVDIDNKVVGSISRYHLISPNKKKIILVDHNEKAQSVNGLEDAEILEIIDHHRLADIQTGLPIYFRNETVGSTSTIIASIFFENGIRPSKRAAGLLCAAIISDTLLFRSPTSTNTDKIMLKRLSEIANIDIDSFANEMFKAGTSLKGRSAEEILNQDLKLFTLHDMKIGVAQFTTMDTESFNPLKTEMIALMEDKAKENNFSLLILMLTDIVNGGSYMLAVGEEKELIARAFNVRLVDNVAYVPDVISRKKQVIPPLTAAINS